ncbi:hypothetical protein SEVIR_6G005800v4 [Setaria viridis]|uniref:Uncharacterized protein n=1 Tax=Setaria viridis TaxID=4556 RepID=A0A4U6U1L3_SETVI|nr:hypothetical protein SEVIR_6G005800v2 [Setaria viridis]
MKIIEVFYKKSDREGHLQNYRSATRSSAPPRRLAGVPPHSGRPFPSLGASSSSCPCRSKTSGLKSESKRSTPRSSVRQEIPERLLRRRATVRPQQQRWRAAAGDLSAILGAESEWSGNSGDLTHCASGSRSHSFVVSRPQ